MMVERRGKKNGNPKKFEPNQTSILLSFVVKIETPTN